MSRTSGNIDFDADTHTYKVDGRKKVNVTNVIKANVADPVFYDPWYAERGKAVHQAIHFINKNTLDWDSLSDEILPRVEAYVKFLNQHPQIDVIESELPLYSRRYQFAGTLDLILQDGNTLILGDIKSSLEPRVELQLGAYSILWHENRKRKINKACAIQLKSDGNFNIKWYKDLKRASRIFLACLTVSNWIKQSEE